MRRIYLQILMLLAFPFIFVSPACAQGWLWAKRAGGTNGEQPCYVATDPSGNVFAGGSFSSTSITLGTTTLTNAGASDVYVAKYDASGAVLWASGAGSSGDDYIESVATDAAGNVYAVGNFGGTSITFGAYTLTNSGGCCGGGANVFVVKYSPAGTVLWAKQAGVSTYYDMATSVATDLAGNVYVTGYFSGTNIVFDTCNLVNPVTGGSVLFLVKYDAAGNAIWARKNGGLYSGESFAVATDHSGHVSITGYFGPPSIVFGTTTLYNTGSGADVFVVQYDTSGTVLWAKGSDGNGMDIGYGIATDPAGNIFVSGSFASAHTTFGTAMLTNSAAGTDDIFLAKYSSAGAFQWAVSAGGANYDRGYALATDDTGNVYMTGYFGSPTVSFGSYPVTNSGTGGSFDMFLAKYSAAGTAKWAVSAGGSGYEYSNSVALDASASILVSGSFTSPSISFGPYPLATAGSSDIYVAKYGQAPAPTGISGGTSVCVGSAITLSDGVTGGTWTSSNTAVATVDFTLGTVTGVSAGATQITYAVTGGYAVASVTVYSLPLTSATSNSPLCAGDTLRLSDLAASGPVSYVWTSTGSYSSTLAAPVITGITTSMAGTYYVTVTSLTTGCSATSATSVVVNPAPTQLTVGGSGTYSSSAIVSLPGSDAGASYQLYKGATAVGAPVSGTGLALSFMVASAGTYYIVATSSVGCTDTMLGTAVIVFETVSSTSLPEALSIMVGPNPVHNLLTVAASRIESIRITDIMGVVVFEDHHVSQSQSIDFSAFCPGMYLVRINGQYVRKVVKE